METIMPFPLRPDNLRTTNKTTLLFYWRLLQLYGEWKSSMEVFNEYFIVQYKKGTNMPADYLSRLPSLPINAIDSPPTIAAFDPFTPDFQLLQCQDQDLQAVFQFLKNGQWHPSLTKQKIRVLAMLAPKVFFDKNKLAWIWLEDHKYPRTAL